MTNSQTPPSGAEAPAPTAAMLGLAALAPPQYASAQAGVGAHLVALMVRAMRKFGLPLSDSARRQMATRFFPTAQRGRSLSYVLATRSMEYSAAAADLALPRVAPIVPYTPDALVKIFERAVEPIEKALAADAAGQSASPLTIIDRRTGQPIAVRDDDHDPGSPRVIYRIAQNAGAAVARHAHQAGRDAVMGTANNADDEIGWARVTTSADPCAFCAMLASRGPVYESDKTADFRAHDHCQCQAVLVYRGKPWVGEKNWQRYERIWISSTADTSGKASIRAFGKALAAANK